MTSKKIWRTLKRTLATLLVVIMFTGIGTSVYGQHYENEKRIDESVRAFLEENTSGYMSKRLNRKGVKGMRETAKRSGKSNGQGTTLEGLNEVALQMSDGSETMYIFSEAVKYLDENGEIQYKDTSIVPQNDEGMIDAGYEYTNGPNDYRLHFSTDPAKGVYINDNQNRITLAPIAASNNIFGMKTETTVDNETVDVFEYPSAFGVDTLLRYTPQLNAVRKDIILKSYQGKNSFDFMLYTHGNIAEVAEDKFLHIKNPITGDIVSAFQPVFAYDSFEGEYSEDETHYTEKCSYGLTEISDSQYKLTITVDQAFLEGATYPVTIDPTASDISTSVDVPIYSEYPDTYFGANQTNCFGRTNSSEYGKGRVYAKFTIPSDIASYATINSAEYWARETTGRTTTTYVRPYLVTGSSPSSSTTWSSRPAYDSSTTMGRRNINSNSSDVSGNPYWYKFDIKAAVKSWVHKESSNYGIIFVSEEESVTTYNWRAFASKENSNTAFRPYAVINYTNDTTAPTYASISGNPTAWTNKNVTLEIVNAADASSGLHSKPYSFDSGTTWQAGATKTYTANTTIVANTIQIRDRAGNIKKRTTDLVISKIDKTAPPTPTVSQSPAASTWTNGSVTLTASSVDTGGSGTSHYSFDNGSTWQTGATKTFTANTTVTIKAKDNAGNISTGKSYTISNIDKTAPTISAVAKDPPGWTNGSVKLTVTAADTGGSGISHYSFDNGSTWQTGNTKSYSANTTLTVKTKDNAGNISSGYSVTISNIDPGSVSGIKITATPTAWTNGNVTLKVSATASSSGIKDYSFDGGTTWQTSDSKAYSANTTIAANQIKVRNNAGTVTPLTTAITISNIDKTAPTISSVSVNPSTWTNGTVTVAVTASDAASGIASYSFDNGASWQTGNSKIYTANTTIAANYIQVKDIAGNITKYPSSVSIKIDKIAPVISSIGGNTSELTIQKTLTVNATDEGGSGIKDYSFDGGTTWQTSNSKTYTINTTIPENSIRVRDNANNVTYYAEKIIIDNIIRPNAPTVFENGDYVGAVDNGTNGGSAVKEIQFKIDDGAWKTFTDTSLPIQREMKYTITLRVVDIAGNASTEVPVNLGAYTESAQDMHFEIFSIPLDFSRSYSSKDNNWVFSLIDSKVEDGVNAATEKKVIMPDGSSLYFRLDNGKYTNASTNATLTAVNGGFILKDGDISYSYNSNGTLVKIQYLDYEYITVTRTNSSITFAYAYQGETTQWVVDLNTNGKPMRITDPNGNAVQYRYNQDGKLDLFTNQNGEETAYAYANNRLSQSGDNTIAYRSDGRIDTITAKNGAIQTYTYKENENKIIISNTAEKSVEYKYNSHLQYTEYTDEQGNVTTYDYWDRNNSEHRGEPGWHDSWDGKLRSEKPQDGDATITYYYDSDGRGDITRTLQNEKETIYSYDDQNNYRLWREKVEIEVESEAENPPKEYIYTYYRYTNGILSEIVKSKQEITLDALDSNMVSGSAFYNSLTYMEKYERIDSRGMPLEITSCNMLDGAKITDKEYKHTTFAYAANGLSVTKTTVAIDADKVESTQVDVSVYESFYFKEISNLTIGDSPEYDKETITDLTGKTLRERMDDEYTRYVYDNKGRLVQQIGATQYDATKDKLFSSGRSYDDTTVGIRYFYNSATGNLDKKINSYGVVADYSYDKNGNLETQKLRDYTQNYEKWGGLESTFVGNQLLLENTYSNDLNHLLESQEYGNGQTIRFAYSDNKITQVKYDHTIAFEYTYGTEDDKDNLREKKDYLNGTVAKYVSDPILDSEEKLEKVRIYDLNSNALLREYYTQDKTEEITVNGETEEKSYQEFTEKIGSEQFGITYKDSRDIISLGGNLALHRNYNKRDDGALKSSSLSLSSGTSLVNTTISYDNSDKLVTGYANALSGQSRNFNYVYDSKGKNITEIRLDGALIKSYEYDTQDQLIRENDSQANRTYVYDYDAFGNILVKKAYAYTTGDLGAELTSESNTYTYDNEGWSDLLTAFNGMPITYDKIGNPTNYLGWNMTWQAGRQLASANKSGMSISYKYDDDGIRQSKTVNDVTTSYTTIDGRVTSQKTGNNLMYFYYDQDNKLIGFDYNGTKYVYVRNLQNDIIGIVDMNGTLVVEYAYDAWGNEITKQVAGSIGVLNPFRYRGYYFDTETGLYYLQSRYYDAQIGRFINADIPEMLELSDIILGTNLFAFCDNNPVMVRDESGKFPLTLVIGGLLGAVIGAVGYFLTEFFLSGFNLQKTWRNWRWWNFGVSVVSGAIDGMLSFSSVSMLLGRVLSAVNSFAATMASGGTILDAVLSGVVGAILGGAGSGKVMQKFNGNRVAGALKNIQTKGTGFFVKEIKNAFSYYFKSNSTLMRIFGRDLLKSQAKQWCASLGISTRNIWRWWR